MTKGPDKKGAITQAIGKEISRIQAMDASDSPAMKMALLLELNKVYVMVMELENDTLSEVSLNKYKATLEVLEEFNEPYHEAIDNLQKWVEWKSSELEKKLLESKSSNS